MTKYNFSGLNYDFSGLEESQPSEPETQDPFEGSIAKDVFTQINTGVANSFIELGKTVTSLALAMEQKIPLGGLYIDENGIRWESNATEEIKKHTEYLKAVQNKLPEAETLAGDVSRVLAQATTGVLLTRKIPSSLGVKARYTQGLISGAVTDFAFFDPYEKRLSNLLLQTENPAFNNTFTQWLAADADDSELEGRMKQAIEGGLIGITFDAVLGGLRYYKGVYRAKAEQKQATELLDKLQPKLSEYRLEGLNQKAAFERVLRESGLESDDAFNAALKTGRKIDFRMPKIDQKAASDVSDTLLSSDGRVSNLTAKISSKFEAALGSLHTSIDNIHQELGYRLRRFEYDTAVNTHQYLDRASRFTKSIDKLNRVEKPLHDQIGIALSNQNYDKALELVQDIKNAELRDSLADSIPKVKQMLKELYDIEVTTGSKTGFLPEYFPRSVRDYDKLTTWLGSGVKSEIDKHIDSVIAKRGRGLSTAEMADEINKFLRTKNIPKTGIARTAHQKVRSIDKIDTVGYQFYANPAEALTDYIHTAVHNIEKRKFFGYGARIPEQNLNLGDSIGNVVNTLRSSGEITAKDANDLTDMLAARFGGGEKASSRSLQNMKNVFYAVTLNDPTNAVSQLGDIAITGYKHGVLNTLKNSAEEITSKLTGKQRLHMRDLGLDRISEEFASTTKTARYLNKLFNATGFKQIDTFGKNVNINSAIDKFSKLAKTEQGQKIIAQKYAKAFTNSEFLGVLADLKAHRITDNVKFIAFNELADVQPVTLSEMPKWYLENPNGRWLYTLRSFTLKQFDILRKDAYQELKKGNTSAGMYNLVRYGTLFTMAGASVDTVKDWMLGRDTEFPDNVKDNLFKMVGMSKYVWDKAEQGNWWNTVVMFLAPPGGAILDPVEKMVKEGEMAQSAKIMPYGKFIYNWLGGGAEEYNKQLEKRQRQQTLQQYRLSSELEDYRTD